MAGQQISAYSCKKCGWSDFYSVNKCPRCVGEISQSTLAGEGKIATFTAIRYPPKGFENQAPYLVAIIDIDNGPRVIGRLSGSPDHARIGSRVSLASEKEGVLEFQLSG